MMHDVMSPVLVFVVTAGLAGIGAEVMSIARTASATQEAVKALMRSELVDRYRTYRDCGGWMSDAHKDEWLHDYGTYHALVGTNGYIDAIRDRVVDLARQLRKRPRHPLALRRGRRLRAGGHIR